MKLFNAAAVIAAALPSTTSAVQIGAPTNYEERKLQDEVGSMPSIDATEAVDAMGHFGLGSWDIFDKIGDLKCEVAAELIDERLEIACQKAGDLICLCPHGERRLQRRGLSGHGGCHDRRLDSHGGHGGEPLCDSLCYQLEGFLDNNCVHSPDPWQRSLGEVEDIPHHRLLEVAEREQGDLGGVVASKDGMLPDSVADSLRAHLEALYDAEEFPPVNSLPKTGRNIARNDIYTVKLDGSELISLIGKDNTRGLLDYFHESLGHEVPVTGIVLQVAKNGDVGQSFTHHRDETATLLVFLNDMDAGGELDYLTNEGHLEIAAKKGRAVAHGPNTVHGAKMWYGDRSLFYFKSSGSHFDDCMLKDLLD